MEWGWFFLAIGVGYGLYCLGCGISEAGEYIGEGLEKLGDAIRWSEGE